MDDVAELDDRALAGKGVGGYRQRQSALVDDVVALAQPEDDRDGLTAAAAVRIADGRAGEVAPDRVVDVLLLDMVIFEIVLVDRQPQAVGADAVGIVDVDDEGHALECRPHLGRHRAADIGVRAVDLGEKRRQHRRSGRRLDDLDRCAGGHGEPAQLLPEVERDLVAGAAALALGQEIDLDVAQLRRRAEIVVADQTVEIERCGGAGVALERDGFGNFRGAIDRRLEHAIGVLDRRALGQIDDDLQIGLVVEGKELDRDVLGVEERERGDGRHSDDGKEDPGPRSALEDGAGDAHVEPAERARAVSVTAARLLPADAHHQPRRQDHGDEEGEEHRRRGIGGDRAHVGAHQPGDEEHRQECRHHGERRHDGRIADFGDGLDRGLRARAAVVHRPVARDVLDDDDGIVDENADREDEREQADAIERVAHDPGGEEREQDRRRDDDGDHDRFAPADGDGDENDDRDGGEAEMEEKLVRLLVGGLAVVAGDRHLDVGREDLAMHLVEPLDDVLGDDDGVGAGTLGDGERHRGDALEAVARLADVGHPVLVGLGDQLHVGDVAEIDRPPVAGGDQQVLDLGNGLQRLAGDQRQLLAVRAHQCGVERAVGSGDLGGKLLEGDAVERELLGVGLDPDLVGLLADDIGEADVGELAHLDLQLAGEAGEVGRRPARSRLGLRRERHHDDGDVVDAAADDERLGNADRDAVEIGADLVVDAEDRGVGAGADDEAGGDHGAVVARLRVDVLDAVDALDDRLERLGHELHRVLGLQPVGADVDVDHRHGDLRLFLARQLDERDEAERERGKQDQRAERRGDERLRQPAGNAELHGTITRSPGLRPLRISTRSPSWPANFSPGMTATSVEPPGPPAIET